MHKIKFLNGKYREFETLTGTDLKGADLRYYELIGANLRFSDLRGANLSCTKLSGANLRGADLRGADLSDADLKGANLFDTSIITFQLGKHFAFYHEGYLRIGCQGHTLTHWIGNVNEIGKVNSYTESQIELYKSMINWIVYNT